MDRLHANAYREDLKSIGMEKLPFEKLKNKKILVTGATGLIGTGIVDALMWIGRERKLNIQVDVLCRKREKAEMLFREYREISDDGFVQVVEGDLTKELNLYTDYDYVIHGGGNNHPTAFATEPVETMKTALLGTIHLLEKLRKQDNHPVFLFLSSGEVYGQSAEQEPSGCKENITGVVNPMELRSCYPEAKRAAETLCKSYAEEYHIDVKIARLCYIFGATYQQSSTKADVQFLQKAVANDDIVMKSPGLQKRSYCYLRDAVSGIFHVLLLGHIGEAYNVANPKMNITIRQFAETLAKTAGVMVRFENPKDIEQKGYSGLSREILNSEKLQALGYQPKVELQEAFEKILEIRRG